LLLMHDDSGLVGCCALTPTEHDGAVYLGMVAVRPGRQGHGLGSALLDAAEAVAVAEFGARAVEMTVIRQRTELIAFYERRGYAVTGELRPFPADDPRFGVPRRDDLVFEVLAKPVGDRPPPRA
ncbi:MAG: GNAT family N-acetyltransferase, partial [Mycobacteriaceae bacterium]